MATAKIIPFPKKPNEKWGVSIAERMAEKQEQLNERYLDILINGRIGSYVGFSLDGEKK